uniref:Uncharacterized protein n=1 Tax=Branchiostoma floridae TaxID=7739 RepID=C3XT69_BRAFL|eukprot:XP_002612793.1 hypothetical protein BRAFLDRAFT_97233 [Branchiostoma floridae]
MAEDNPDAVPRVQTLDVSDESLTELRSDARMKTNFKPYANSLVNPMYEIRCSPTENDAVEDNTTKAGIRYPQNANDNLTNSGNLDKDKHPSVSIMCKEHEDNHMPESNGDAINTITIASDDVNSNAGTDENTYQNDMMTPKLSINATSPQNRKYQNPLYTITNQKCLTKAVHQPNSAYIANISGCHSCTNPYAATVETTTYKDDYGKDILSQNNIVAEFPEPVYMAPDNADLEPYAVAYEVQDSSHLSGCNSTEHDADNVDPVDDDTDIPTNRHIPSTDPNTLTDTLNRNPMYVPNIPQQARCRCTYGMVGIAVMITALMISAFFGTWLYYNRYRAVHKMNQADDAVPTPGQSALDTTYIPGHPAVVTSYTDGHPAVVTGYTDGHPAVVTSYTDGHPAVVTSYTAGHPAVVTSYTAGHPAVNTAYTHDHPAVDTTYTDGNLAVGTTNTNGHPTSDTGYIAGQRAVDTSYLRATVSYVDLFSKEKGRFFGDHPDHIVSYSDIDADECARRCLRGFGSYDGVVPPCLSFNHRPAGSPEGGSARCWLRRSTKDIAASPGPEWFSWPHRNYYQRKGLKKEWRDDLRCGKGYPVQHGTPAECDPDGKAPCCSVAKWCGGTTIYELSGKEKTGICQEPKSTFQTHIKY